MILILKFEIDKYIEIKYEYKLLEKSKVKIQYYKSKRKIIYLECWNK